MTNSSSIYDNVNMLVNGGSSCYVTSSRRATRAAVDTRNSSPVMSYGTVVKDVSSNRHQYLTAPQTIIRQREQSESPDSAASSVDSSPKSEVVDSDSGGSARGSDPPAERRWRRSLEDVRLCYKNSGRGADVSTDPMLERFGTPYEIGALRTPDTRYSLAYSEHPTLAMYSKQPQTAFRCLTSDLPLKKRFRRAGIIPYAYFRGKQHYLMAIDSKYQELSDFGGQVKHRERFIDAVCRELYEETLGFFDYTSEESKRAVLQSSIAIHDDKETLIVFQEIQCQDPLAVLEEYQRRASKLGDQENSGMLWVPHDIFVHLYQSQEAVKVSETESYPKMYCRISDLISIVGGLFEEDPDFDTGT